jgi:Membrane domain of glycerophosphoryl diester phosphodiesterase
MRTQSIAPERLLQNAFSSVVPIYGSVLLFFLPGLIFNLLNLVISKKVLFVISLIYSLSIGITFLGAAIFYVYQKLNQIDVTILQSLQKSARKLPQLILLAVLQTIILMSGLILFIIPGIYFSVRLSFAFYAIIIENLSATNALNRSWQLVKGHWWQVFWAFFVLFTISCFISILSSTISGFIFGLSPFELIFKPSGSGSALYRIISGIFGLLFAPISQTYGTLLFIGLLTLEKRGTTLV